MSNEIKSRPIIFSAQMVKAILEDRKSQTRRAIKPQPVLDYKTSTNDAGWTLNSNKVTWRYDAFCEGKQRALCGPYRCPYGNIGDKIWVKETFLQFECYCLDCQDCRNRTGGDSDRKVWYRADGDPCRDNDAYYSPWKPSIFMPRWASRITLEITDIRVERLMDISEPDARAEGVEPSVVCTPDDVVVENYAYGFFGIWEKINGEGAVDKNPYVFAISFKRVLL